MAASPVLAQSAPDSGAIAAAVGAVNYVALGDSYASGEGNEPFYDNLNCHRSKSGYPWRLASAVSTLQLTETSAVPCTGAVTLDIYNDKVVRTGPRGSTRTVIPAQTKAITSSTRLVTITIGGNDLNFDRILGFCVLQTISCEPAFLTGQVASYKTKLAQRLDQAYSAIRTKLSSVGATNAQVIVVDYPRLFPTYPTECAAVRNPNESNPIPIFNGPGFSVAEMTAFNNVQNQINNVIHDKAEEYRFSFVEVEDAFNGNEICTDAPFINGLLLQPGPFSLGSVNIPELNPASFHPNANGHQRIAELIEDELETLPGATGSISGHMTNAATGAALPGATIRVLGSSGQPACSNATVVATTTTNSNGDYSFPTVASGTYDVQARAAGFISNCQDDAQVSSGQNTLVSLSLSPTLAAGALRVVLTWGADPRDLDSHLWTPSQVPYHVYYPPGNRGSTTQCPFAQLNVDDTDGLGPETITIAQRQTGQYRYAVHRFAGSGSLASSGAQVQVFGSSGLIATYSAPSGTGDWWYVFNIDGATGGVQLVNQISNTEPSPYADTTSGCPGAATAVAGSAAKADLLAAVGTQEPSSSPSVAAAEPELSDSPGSSEPSDRAVARAAEVAQRSLEREQRSEERRLSR